MTPADQRLFQNYGYKQTGDNENSRGKEIAAMKLSKLLWSQHTTEDNSIKVATAGRLQLQQEKAIFNWREDIKLGRGHPLLRSPYCITVVVH